MIGDGGDRDVLSPLERSTVLCQEVAWTRTKSLSRYNHSKYDKNLMNKRSRRLSNGELRVRIIVFEPKMQKASESEPGQN